MKNAGKLYLFLVCTVLFTVSVASSQTEDDLLAVHEQFKQAINAQDAEGMTSFYMDDCIVDYVTLPEPFMGIDEVRQENYNLFTGWPDFHVEQRKLIVSGNIMVTECSTTATHLGEWMEIPPTGKTIPHIHMDIYQFEGTKIKKHTIYMDIMTLLIGMGIAPEPQIPELTPSFEIPEAEPTGLSSLETIQELAKRWNTHNAADYSKLFTPDADILIASFGTPMDKNAFIASQELFVVAFPDIHVEILNQVDLGDGWVLGEDLYSGTHLGPYFGLAPSGRQFQIRGGLLYHVTPDGLIDYAHIYWDQVTMMNQLGAMGGAFPPGLTVVPEGFETDIILSPSLVGNAQQDPWLRNMIIYLPPSYDQGGNFPVIYLLHGYGSNEGSYVNKDHPSWIPYVDWDSEGTFPENGFDGMLSDLMTSSEMKEAIIVIPDGSSKYGGGYCTNSVLNGNHEDYIVQDLVSYIDNNYQTIPHRDSRAIIGQSIGGYGALKLAMKHPDIFGAVASLGGMLNFELTKAMRPAIIAENPDGMTGPSMDKPFTSMGYSFFAAFTPNLSNPPFFVDLTFEYPSGKIIDAAWDRAMEHDLTNMLNAYSGNLASLRGIYIDCGNQDEFGFNYHTQAFHQSLSMRGIGHLYEPYEGGHVNKLYERLAVSLPFISDALVSEGITTDEETIHNIHQDHTSSVNTKNLAVLQNLWASDIVFDYVPSPPAMRGEEQVTAFFQSIFNAFPDFSTSIIRDFVSGDIVVDEQTMSGTHEGEWGGIPGTGKMTQNQKLDVFEFENGEIKRITTYHDNSLFLIQIGAMPEPEIPPFEPSFEIPDPEPNSLSPLEAAKEEIRRWNAHDLVGNLKMQHEDDEIFFAPFGVPMDRRAYAGLQELYLNAFPDLQVLPVRFVELGEGWILCECVWEGTHLGPYFGIPATGLPSSIRGAMLYHFNEQGLETNFHVYFDSVQVLVNIGAISPITPPPLPPLSDRLKIDTITSLSLENNLLGDPAERDMVVYLPPSYDENPDMYYPTVYLLHGFGCNHLCFTKQGLQYFFEIVSGTDMGLEISKIADSLIENQEITEMIIVTPDASTSLTGSWYANSPVLGDYQNYIATDVLNYIDDNYRTLKSKEYRGIAGHSMGGYGALSIAMQFHEKFGGVAALGPGNPNNFEKDLSVIDRFIENSPDTLRTPNLTKKWQDLWDLFFTAAEINSFYSMAAAFSPNVENEPYFVDLPIQYPEKTIREDIWQKWIDRDLAHLIARQGENLIGIPIYIDQGVGPVLMMEEVKGIEFILEALDEKDIPYTYQEFDGDHLTHLALQVTNALKFLSKSFGFEPVSVENWENHQ